MCLTSMKQNNTDFMQQSIPSNWFNKLSQFATDLYRCQVILDSNLQAAKDSSLDPSVLFDIVIYTKDSNSQLF